jgi:UDP-N-acetylmuramyl pentapeptide phosphotransferase/UDP-N-acetylglucosamine-1-phosphate transferase
MSQLQGMDDGQAAAQLRGRLMPILIPWVLLHLVLAALGTWLARRYALRRKLIDQPGERRSHRAATPRGGGISIVVVTGLGALVLSAYWPAQAPLLASFVLGLLLVAGIGWWDDHRSLSPWLRLAVQGLAALILGGGFYRSTGLWFPALAAVLLAMVLVNVWNFMDGIDGLATTQAGLVATGLAVVVGFGPWVLVAAGLAAATCGFLPFNFPKARVFLGDVGSGALGYMLAALLLVGIMGGTVMWPLLFLPLAAFLVDSSFTLMARMLRGERWWTPHVQHAYQRWARSKGRHTQVTWAYGLFSLGAVIVMLIPVGWRPLPALAICLVWYALAGWGWWILQKDHFLSREATR